MTELQTDLYALSPVQAVRVTSTNMAEVAEWCGGTILETPSKRKPGTMAQYVRVPTPKANSNSWAFPGMMITKRLVVGDRGEVRATYAVFRNDYFQRNYFQTTKEAIAATWLKEEQPAEEPTVVAEKVKETLAVKPIHEQRIEEREEAVEKEALVESFVQSEGPDLVNDSLVEAAKRVKVNGEWLG